MAATAGSLISTQRDRLQQAKVHGDGEAKWVDLVKHVWGSSRPDPLPKGAVLPDAALKRVQLLFLVCGIGTSMAWYAISGAVAYWSKNYGDDIYGVFLFAYNGPALFLLLAQTAEDDKYDRKFGSKAAYSFRTYLGYVVLFSCCLALLLIDHKPSPGGLANRIPLLIVVGIVGVFDSVGYGSLAQMASKLHPRVSTYMFIGQSLTSFLLLGWTLALGFGASADDVLLLDYFLFPMGWIVVGVIAFTVVMNSSDVTDRLKFVDDQSAGVEQVNPMLEAGAKQAQEAKREAKGDDAEGGDIRRADSKHVEATVTSAVSASWEMQLSTFLVMVSILTVQTFYAQVPSASGTDAANRQLGTTLVYSKFAGEFIGKQVCANRPKDGFGFVKSPKTLLFAVSWMPLHIVAFSLYTSGSLGFLNDTVIVAACTLFAGYEAYYLSLCYVFVPEELRGKTASVLNLVLMIGILFGNQVLARLVGPLAITTA